MNGRVEQLTNWCYGGLWGILTGWFRVPQQPPSLPSLHGEQHDTFRPADGFLRYLKLQFWILLVIIDLLVLVVWIGITVAVPMVGIVLAIPALVIAIVPDIVAYLAIHLRFDTTWYVLSDRSLRIRRGIWVIHETTITFENVQNISVRQGPLQRYFGIADVLVETAGGGGSAAQPGHSAAAATGPHTGLIEGVADASRIRDLLMNRLRQSRTAGLGDEASVTDLPRTWSPERLSVLREIRDSVTQLVTALPAGNRAPK